MRPELEARTSAVTGSMRSVYGSGLQVWAWAIQGHPCNSVGRGERWHIKNERTAQTVTAAAATGEQLWTVGTEGTICTAPDGGQELGSGR